MAEESHFRLRIPADLKAQIEAAAKEAGRSLNAQVIYTLQLSMEQESEIEELKSYREDHEERIKALEKDVMRLLDSTGIDYYDRD